jgi:hypothetical protein
MLSEHEAELLAATYARYSLDKCLQEAKEKCEPINESELQEVLLNCYREALKYYRDQ